jgi:hypothetical protein
MGPATVPTWLHSIHALGFDDSRRFGTREKPENRPCGVRVLGICPKGCRENKCPSELRRKRNEFDIGDDVDLIRALNRDVSLTLRDERRVPLTARPAASQAFTSLMYSGLASWTNWPPGFGSCPRGAGRWLTVVLIRRYAGTVPLRSPVSAGPQAA